MKLGSRKLIERARAILMRTTGASAQRATRALDASGRNLPVALVMLARKVSREQAQALLAEESQHDVLERILGGTSLGGQTRGAPPVEPHARIGRRQLANKEAGRSMTGGTNASG